MGKALYTLENGSCLIHNSKPPRYWYNYLWNDQGYCAQVSQIGHGRSYYINDRADMCRLNNEDARYLYLRDDCSGQAWCVGGSPLPVPVDDYSCEHTLAYSRLASRFAGIHASWRIFVPEEGYHEIWTVTLRNESDTERNISLFSAVSFDLEGFSYPRYYEMYRCIETSFDSALNGVYCASSHPFAPHQRYNAFLASSEPVYRYDGDLSKFCGATGSITQPDSSARALFQVPEIVMNGQDCTNSDAALFIVGGVLQHRIVLQPGEEKTIQMMFGVCESLEEARKVRTAYSNSESVESALHSVQNHLQDRYSTLTVRTPDESINRMMNRWVQKQIDCCIVGKKGVRDNLQIAVAMLDFRPDKAKAEILECLSHQFQDGHAVLTWYPYDDTRYSDQPFWIIWATCELIKETGEFSLLDLVIPWQDGGEDTVLGHLKAAVRCLLESKGPNGLPKLFFADWNDALNVTTDPEAESVMLAHQTCLALLEASDLMERVGDAAYAAFLRQELRILKEAINTAAWDGEWYMRALSREENIGSRHSTGSTIYLNAQTWAVLGDVAEGERLDKVLAAIDNMEQDFGFPLNLPPYASYSPNTGRMSGMLPGLFENGGVYCHASAFKILADCRTGRASQAIRTLKKIMPDSDLNPVTQSGAEPYVFTNCYATHPKYYGKSYQSWTTGTSAWALMGLYEGILGIKRDYDGLRLAPCFPASWHSAEATRVFRNAEYHIVILNPDGIENGVPHITVDQEPIEGSVLPDFRDGKHHEVVVLNELG